MNKVKIEYVLGFLFDQKSYGVLLIQKQKPEWQKGLFNGIGGKIEKDETPLQAMRREFKEEAGLSIGYWKSVCKMEGEDWKVHVFTSKDDSIHDFKSMTDEEVNYIPLDDLKDFDVITNLDWLIPMCLGKINYYVSTF